MKRILLEILPAFALLLPVAVSAQETRSIDPRTHSPKASIEQVAWLTGEWRGVDDEGNASVESWQGPVGGVMTGSFIQLKTDAEGKQIADWTEHMVIAPRGDSISFYMAAFAGEGIEETFHRFRLVAVEGCTVYFHTVTYQCESENGEIVGMTVVWERTDPLPGEDKGPIMYRYERVR